MNKNNRPCWANSSWHMPTSCAELLAFEHKKHVHSKRRCLSRSGKMKIKGANNPALLLLVPKGLFFKEVTGSQGALVHLPCLVQCIYFIFYYKKKDERDIQLYSRTRDFKTDENMALIHVAKIFKANNLV